MINLFASCGDIASVGIIVDFAEDIETYVVGTPADIKNWAYKDCPKKLRTELFCIRTRLEI